MMPFVNVCDVISAEKRYARIIVNYKTKMHLTCVSSFVSLVVRKKEFQQKRFITLEEINLSSKKPQVLEFMKMCFLV